MYFDRETKIRYTWYLTVFDVGGMQKTIPFDIVDGISPSIVGLDIWRNEKTKNMHHHSYLQFKRQQDNHERKFLTFVDQENDGD